MATRAKLYVTNGFGLGGIVGPLALMEAVTTEQIDGNDSAQFTVRQPYLTPLAFRSTLRLIGSDGVEREYRVRRMQRDPKGEYCRIEAGPPFQDLSTAGLIYQIVNGSRLTSFGGTMTAAQWISTYVLTNLAAAGLSWLDTTLGTIDSTQLVTLQFSQWTRAQLLRALADATGLELYLAQPTPGALYRVNLVTQRASAVPAVRVSRGRNLLALALDSTDEGLATVVEPFGDVPEGDTEPATLAQHVWSVGTVSSSWVQLTDPSGAGSPVFADDMLNGKYLQFLSGTSFVRRVITDTRVSDGSVLLADASGLSAGMQVQVVDDASGTPLTELISPTGVAAFGRVVVPLSVAGVRGERNLVPNANFAAGAGQMSPVGGGWIEAYPTTETTDQAGAANGAHLAGATTLNADGFGANTTIRRGEIITIGSVTVGTTNATKTVPSSNQVTVPLASGATVGVTAGTAVTIGGTPATVATTFSAGATSVVLNFFSGTPKPSTAMSLRFAIGGNYRAMFDRTANYSYPNTTSSFVYHAYTMPLDAAVLWVDPSGTPVQLSSGTISAGTALTLVDSAGATFNVTVTSTYTIGATSIALNILLYPFQVMQLAGGAFNANLYYNTTNSQTRAITGTPAEWPDNLQQSLSFASAIGFDVPAGAVVNVDGPGGIGIMSLTAVSAISAAATSGTFLLVYPNLTVPTGSALVFPGTSATVGTTAVANGSGVVAIPLSAGLAAAVADNATLSINRNALGWPDLGASSTRMLRISNSASTADITVPVAAGATVTLWAHAALIAQCTGVGQIPKLQVVNAATGAVLAEVSGQAWTSPPVYVGNDVTPEAQTLKVSFQLTNTTRVRLVAQGASGASFVWPAFVAYWMLTEGTDPNVPFTAASHANALWYAGIRYLKVYAKEVRNITASLVNLSEVIGASLTVEQLVCGGVLQLVDVDEILRIGAITRDHLNLSNTRYALQTLSRSIARLVGTGSSAASTGATVSAGAGTGTGGATTVGFTVADDAGTTVPGVETLIVSGLGVAVAAQGVKGARLTIPTTVDPTGVDAVIEGGDWITRDLVTQPGYEIAVTAGQGLINGRLVSWPQSAITTPAANALVYVDGNGTLQARGVAGGEVLTTNAELLLYRTYVDTATYGNRIYAVAESRTFYRFVPRKPLYLAERVSDAVVASGTWANAVAVNATGGVNFYFANLGLYPFVEELPSVVLGHLNVQIAKFFGASGTANSAPTWNSVHGTTWSSYYKWPYDVDDPRGTPVVKRADSHDAYIGTFLRLAVRYARKVSGGLTWWDANIAAIQDAIYYNILLRQRLVGGGAGYMNETFQDPAVYPFCQTLDNIEVYRGLKDALDLMTERGGAQATWASTYSGTASGILSGVQSQWSDSANAAGESGWLSVAWDNNGAAKLTNQLTRFYPDLSIAVPAIIYDVPLHGTPSIARDRLSQSFAWLNQKAPTWFMSRRYDLFPWGMLAAAAAKAQFFDLAERWLTFVQTHHVNDSPGYFLIHDIGWARYAQRVIRGEALS